MKIERKHKLKGVLSEISTITLTKRLIIFNLRKVNQKRSLT